MLLWEIWKDHKAARRHLRECPKLRNKNDNAIEGNDIEELFKTQLAIEGSFDMTELEQDINFVNLASDLSNKTKIHREFTKHFNNDNAKECLVALSQDKHFSNAQCSNLPKVDVNLQFKSSKLHSQLPPTE